MKYYGCDAHKKYCMFSYMDENGDHGPCLRVSNEKEHFINFLETLPPGSSIAIETVGNYYWMVDAMEKAGHKPKLANSVRAHLELLDQVEAQIKSCEEQIKAVVKETPEMTLLKTIPGVGDILAIVIALEVGDVSRFPRAQKLASYAGTVPRIKDSGGRRY